MLNLKRIILREIPAVSIFSFLIGMLLVILMRKKFAVITEYVDVFSFQLNQLNVSDINLFICIFLNRLSILFFVFLCSYFYKNKYCIYILAALFFLLYGIFVSLNFLALGIRGIITGVLLFVPQWLLYITSYLLCIKQNILVRSNKKIQNIIQVILMIFIIFAGSIIESYVTQPLIFKFF